MRTRHISGRLALVAAWSAAEATIWPFLPDAALVPLAVARPGEWWRLVTAAAAGTLAGGLVSYTVGRVGPAELLLSRLPLVRPAMVRAASGWLAAEGAAGLRHHPLSGVPFKVFALLAGSSRQPPGPFFCWALAVRGARFAAVSALAALLARPLAPLLQRTGPLLLLLWSLAFLAGLRQTVRSWERRSD
jgi:membrane protein YqaA with SNARE-associated domain